MVHQVAGKSLIAFGTTSVVSAVIVAIFFDALMVDLVAVIVIGLGISVSHGNRRAAKWATVVMTYYLVGCLGIAGGSLIAPGFIRVSGKPLRPEMVPWVLAVAAIGACWSGATLGLLIRFLRRSAATA